MSVYSNPYSTNPLLAAALRKQQAINAEAKETLRQNEMRHGAVELVEVNGVWMTPEDARK